MEASKAGYDHSWRSSLNIEKKKKSSEYNRSKKHRIIDHWHEVRKGNMKPFLWPQMKIHYFNISD